MQKILAGLQLRPAQSLAASFLVMILVGTVLLSLPISSATGQATSFVDALFTAVSAVCVTGLIVVDTPTHFSMFGQLVILFLIQLGGLGIMTFSTSLALAFGRRIGLREKVVMQDVLDQTDVEDTKRLVVYIVKMTFLIELTGAVLLSIRWYPEFGDVGRTVYFAIFHSISAFCNAGFSLFSDSFMGYRGDITLNLILTSLIILGGIGFVVVADLHRSRFWMGRRSSTPRLALHTKLVLSVTLILLVFGTALFFLVEYNNSMNGTPIVERLLSSYFQSVTARTAGFNTLDTRSLSHAALFVTVLLMFIGASPGSTGGGIKTSTIGVLYVFTRSIFRGKEEVELFRRNVPRAVVYKAIVIVIFATSFLVALTIPLFITENAPFMDVIFEAVSAFGTVGLSLGLTSKLTDIGKVLIILLMFVGRIGPLTIAYAVGRRKERVALGYPEGRVMVG
ncbi:MAG TPA: Trk family potassium uptake protein [Candidatus Latescibacteria bacterium]|nr:Trk family potassium uptake protein [Candidatus Latescibacterota bacterium]